MVARNQATARPAHPSPTAAAAAARNAATRHLLQAELGWLLRAVNPEVPLGEAALGLIMEEVRLLCRSVGGCFYVEALAALSSAEATACDPSYCLNGGAAWAMSNGFAKA